MLKITFDDSGDTARIRLEGKLTDAWTPELENCWRSARRKPVIVDLTNVDYADLAGRYLLAWMHARGARLIASTLPMQELVGDITTANPARGRNHHRIFGCFLLLTSFMLLAAADLRAQDGPVLHLTLQRAIEIALSPEGSARYQLANENVKQAEAKSLEARAALLPDLDAYAGYQNQTRNLEAFGIRFPAAPAFVGPFSALDVRTNVRQSVLDFGAIRRYQSSRAAASSVKADRDSAGEQIAMQVARLYLTVLRAGADVASAKANVDLAQALLDLVENQKKAGTGTGIEAIRARVQLANEEQRLLVANNQRRASELELLRAAGLRLDTHLELDGELSYVPVTAVPWEKATEIALRSRADYKAQQERERSAELAATAASMERVPSLSAFADYGSIGTGLNSALPTRTYGVSVRIPVFDGGRRNARRAEGASRLRQEQIRTHDLREQIELEIRLALDSLASAEQQVTVAAEGLRLAKDELASARRRYEAGVAGGVEVTDAQTRLERARDNHVTALFAHNLARLDLAEAQGILDQIVR